MASERTCRSPPGARCGANRSAQGSPDTSFSHDFSTSHAAIRYRVGDLGVMSDHSCTCGRGFSVMDSIRGRDTDAVSI